MSDGPHRSLKMSRGWKRLAERADKSAYSPKEVCDALPEALKQDWLAEVPGNLCKLLRRILGTKQGSLSSGRRIESIEALRRKVAGYSLGNILLDYVIQTVAQGLSGASALKQAGARTLSDRAMRGARQVEEHYQRKSTQGRAARVRERIEAGVVQSDMAAIAGSLAGIDSGKGLRRPVKQTGLDEGVQL